MNMNSFVNSIFLLLIELTNIGVYMLSEMHWCEDHSIAECDAEKDDRTLTVLFNMP